MKTNTFGNLANIKVTYNDGPTETCMMRAGTSTVVVQNRLGKDIPVDFAFQLSSIPSTKIDVLGKVSELNITDIKNFPYNDVFAQGNAWAKAIKSICRENPVGWILFKLAHSDKDLMRVFMDARFIPVITDDGTEALVAYYPVAPEAPKSVKPLFSSNKRVIEAISEDESSYVRLRIREQYEDLASTELGRQNPGLRHLAPIYKNMHVYDIEMVKHDVIAPSDPAFPHISYKLFDLLSKVLNRLGQFDVNGPMVCVVAHGRYEYLACLGAGFYPLESPNENETYFVRFF